MTDFRGLIGLDISDLVIRAVTLNAKQPLPAVTAFQELLLPRGIVDDGEIRQPRVLANSIHTLLQHAQPSPLRKKLVVACLPDRKSFLKRITVPATAKEKLEATLRQHIVQHIPFTLEDMYLDWQEIPSPDPATSTLLVGAAPKPLVESYLATIEAAGLTVAALEMESLALTRAILADSIPNPGMLLVDIGGTRTTIMATGQGTPQFSSSLPFCGADFTRGIATALRLSFDDAERVKLTVGFQGRTKMNAIRALQTPLDLLARHLRDIIAFFENHFPEPGPVRSLLLSGGGAQLKGIDGALATALKLPVKVGAAQVHIPSHLKFPLFRLPSFTTAVGLAMHGV